MGIDSVGRKLLWEHSYSIIWGVFRRRDYGGVALGGA